MEVIEFRKILTNDIYDNYYNDGFAWSRIYEYPLVISIIKKYYKEDYKIHNSSWGFAGCHVLFKEKLDELFKTVYHSDIIKSDFNNTFVYDITKTPEKEEREKYDILLNVSTLEDVNYNHIDIFNNLFLQLKKGGIFIATYDLNKKVENKIISFFLNKEWSSKSRVLQLEKFEKLFSKKIEVRGEPLNGMNSHLKNLKCKRLNCGVMVIKK